MTFKPTRRELIAGGIGAGMSLPMITPAAPWMSAGGAGFKKIVVLQLNGGNDMINNMVNPDEPKYNSARPTIKLPKNRMIRVDNSSPFYLHPRLQPLKALLDLGEAAIMPGVGYTPANLSHFRSMDIWAAADPSAVNVRTGWLASWLQQNSDTSAIKAMNFEGRLNRVFAGHPVPVFRNPSTFRFLVDNWSSRYIDDDALETALIESNAKVLRPTANPNLKFLADAIAKVPADSALIQNTGSSYSPRATYPNTTADDRRVSQVLQLAARYIVGGLSTPLYFMSLGGFDNHANLVNTGDTTTGRHADLLGAWAAGVKAFLDDLKAWGKADDVIVYTSSEFGRRCGENGNNGTDHGKAGIAYVVGKPVKNPGIKTPYPSWAPIRAPYNRANMEATTDFRRILATLLDDYWSFDSTKVLGKKYQSLGIF